jgi:tetratricopeptide (TPR) repeat protein
MPGKAPGRNDPCPCGSGKKYKKCCLPKQSVPLTPEPPRAPGNPTGGVFYEDYIDQLSNRAVDAIQQKRYEDAERLCEQLLRDFPTLIAGHDRVGMLGEAQGRFSEAAHHYARALQVIAESPGGYDPEVIQLFEERRKRALSKSAPRP